MAPIQAAVYIPGEKYFPVIFGQGTPEELFASIVKKSDIMIP